MWTLWKSGEKKALHKLIAFLEETFSRRKTKTKNDKKIILTLRFFQKTKTFSKLFILLLP